MDDTIVFLNRQLILYQIGESIYNNPDLPVSEKLKQIELLFKKTHNVSTLASVSLEADTSMSEEIALESLSSFLKGVLDGIRDKFNDMMDNIGEFFSELRDVFKSYRSDLKDMTDDLASNRVQLKSGTITLGKNQQRWLLSDGQPIDPVAGINAIHDILEPTYSGKWFKAIQGVFNDWTGYEQVLQLIEDSSVAAMASIDIRLNKKTDKIVSFQSSPKGMPGGLYFRAVMIPYIVGTNMYWHLASAQVAYDKLPDRHTKIHEYQAFDISTFKQVISGLDGLITLLDKGLNGVQGAAQHNYDAFRSHYSSQLALLGLPQDENKNIWVASLGLFTIIYWYLNDTHRFIKSYLRAMTNVCRKSLE